MRTIHPSPLLKAALLVDAIASGATAMLHLLLNRYLSDRFGLDGMLLLFSGIFLLGYANLLLVLAFTDRIWSSLLYMVIVGNLMWVAGCAFVITGSMSLPTQAMGTIFVAAQGIAVLALAACEYVGLRTSVEVPPRRFAPVRMQA